MLIVCVVIQVTGLEAEDVLLYYYYAGIVLIGAKRFKAALQSFSTVGCP